MSDEEAICRNCDQPIVLLQGTGETVIWLHTDDRAARSMRECLPPPRTLAEPEGMSDHE